MRWDQIAIKPAPVLQSVRCREDRVRGIKAGPKEHTSHSIDVLPIVNCGYTVLLLGGQCIANLKAQKEKHGITKATVD